MKISTKYILGSFAMMVLIFQLACKREFLEIVPKGQAIATLTADYEKLLNTNYLASLFTASVYQGDELAALQPDFDNMAGEGELRQQRLFKYEARIYNPADLPTEVTDETNYIRRLYLYNKVINEVMDSKGGSEAQKLALLAEARAGRAICNFMFLSDFTKPYNAATAGTDLGIPNLTLADVTQKDFKRGTLQAAYDLVVNDLKEALPHLRPVTHRRKISKLAGEFYLSRVYMAMNNFNAAKLHLDAAFLEVQKAEIPMALYDYTKVLDPEDQEAEGSWFPEGFLGLDNVPLAANNTEIIYNINASWFRLGTANAFVFSPQTAALYTTTDRRLNLYSPYKLFTTTAYPMGMRRRNTDFFLGINVGPSLPDLYLMRAECLARSNDLAAAVEDLQLLRSKRIAGAEALVPASVAANQEALVKFILDERIREFAITGLRWLDMRRLSVDPIYRTHIKFNHKVYNQNGMETASHELKPERFALKFGERMINESNGLEENP